MDENEPIVASNNEPFHSSQVELEYMTSKSQSHVGKVVNSTIAACQQHALNEDLTLNQPASYNMFKVQLNYNPNQVLDPES